MRNAVVVVDVVVVVNIADIVSLVAAERSTARVRGVVVIGKRVVIQVERGTGKKTLGTWLSTKMLVTLST